jgi:uncharacterized protein
MSPQPATGTHTPVQAFFLPGPATTGGQRLAVLRRPMGPLRGSVLHVHAFAEEMNKSRRMVMLASQALAEAGFAVLQIDLLGCGDSSGELADATWNDWVDDVTHAAAWLSAQHPGPQWLWGARSGCLLAAAAAARLSGERHLLFWQAQGNGKLVLQQFLRLKMASQMQSGAHKGVTEGLLRELANGQAVDVAGYRLGPGVAQGLESASLQVPAGLPPLRLVWLEVSSREPAALLPASLATQAAWQQAGHQVQAQAVAGPPFWQTLEIEDAPDLVQATVAALAQK